ncbi:chemotaxis protein CheW [Xanthomonas sp. Kuri4-3]
MHAHTVETAPSDVDGGDALPQFLTFQLGGEMFATSILGISEIIEYRAPTPVPTMPTCVRGVINLRGAVVPVIDLQARLGREPSTVGKRSCIVILASPQVQGQQVIGVLVDAVNEVLGLPAADVEPAPSFGTQIRRDLLSGMGKVGDRFVILLDMERVLQVEEIAAGTVAAAA